MLAKKITYTDYNGDERTETFYFNLTKAEVLEMQMTHPGGYSEYLERIIDAKDQAQLFEAFKTLVRNAYGEKSEDGKRFKKSDEIADGFLQSEAYSELLSELITSADAASAFVQGIMPIMNLDDEQKAELAAKTKKLIAEKGLAD